MSMSLNRVLDIASQSSVLKSKFKKEVLDEVFDKRRDVKETEKKLERSWSVFSER